MRADVRRVSWRGVCLRMPGSLAAVRLQQRRSAAGKSMKDCLRDNIFIRQPDVTDVDLTGHQLGEEEVAGSC